MPPLVLPRWVQQLQENYSHTGISKSRERRTWISPHVSLSYHGEKVSPRSPEETFSRHYCPELGLRYHLVQIPGKNLFPALGRDISSLSTLLPLLNKSQGSYSYSGTMEGIALDKAANGNYYPVCNIRVKAGPYFLEKEQ